MLTWIAGAIAYLLVGNILARVWSTEYFNDTDTEKIGLLGKFRRMLLYPISYHSWYMRDNNNGDSTFGGSNFPAGLRGLCGGAEYRYTKNSDTEILYQRWVSVLWPTKILQPVIGLIEMLAIGIWTLARKTVGGIFGVVSWILDTLGSLPEKIPALFKKMRRWTPSTPSNVTGTVAELERYKNSELQVESDRLTTELGTLGFQMEETNNHLREVSAKAAMLSADNDKFAPAFVAKKHQLERVCEGIRQRQQSIKEARDIINAGKSDLEKCLHLVTVQAFIEKNAPGEGTDGTAELIGQACGIREHCRTIVGRAFDVHTTAVARDTEISDAEVVAHVTTATTVDDQARQQSQRLMDTATRVR